MKASISTTQLPLDDFELGEINAVAGEPFTHKVEIPITDGHDRAKAKARVEVGGDRVDILEQMVIGAKINVSLRVLSPIHGEFPISIRVDVGARSMHANGVIKVDYPRPLPFGLSGIIGSQSSAQIPFSGQLWKAATYTATIQPPTKEFRLSQAKGEMAAGAKVFPFKVFFAPRDPRPIEALLVVDCGDVEITVKVCGSTGGFQGRRWGERRH